MASGSRTRLLTTLIVPRCAAGVAGPSGAKKALNNLCGDLNKGVIPRNPMRPSGLSSSGSPYPL